MWNALYNAAQTRYYANQQDIAAKIAQLEDQLTNVDTLTLRREESEEVMKMAVATLLGGQTNTYWQNLKIFGDYADPKPWPPLSNPLNLFGEKLDLPANVSPGSLGSAFSRIYDQQVYPLLPWIQENETVARFINQAIEWENVLTFLYSYFWDIPESWEFTRSIQHPDPTRQAFLRAGSARVVLTIRKGWEHMWDAFVQTGIPYYTGDKDPKDPKNPIPYLTIAQEIAAYDDRNYPGIPPANPEQTAVRLEDAVYTTSNTYINPSQSPVPTPIKSKEIEVTSSAGFLVGAQVVIDSLVAENYPAGNHGRQEATIITAIRDDTHITLAEVTFPHGDSHEVSAYAVIQPGEKGVLIAEWNEYTPTSGTDIAVTSNLATIA